MKTIITTKKETRGGPREGAGRKSTQDRRVTKTIRLPSSLVKRVQDDFNGTFSSSVEQGLRLLIQTKTTPDKEGEI